MDFTEEKTGALFHNINQLCVDQESSIDYETLKCRALWRAVITQALMDAASNSKKHLNKKNKINSIQWLKSNNEDFQMVCYLADLDPDYVKLKAAYALSRGCKWRNDKRKETPIIF